MSQYIENNLGSGERIVMKAKKNALYLLPAILWLLICIVGAIALSVLKPWVPVDPQSLEDLMNYDEALKATPTLLGIIWGTLSVAGFLPFLIALLKFLSVNLAVTNKRVIGKVGILRINTVDVPIGKVDYVQVKAGVIGNIFNYYSLRVVSASGGGYDSRRANDRFVGISNAQEFKNTVTAAIERHAEEARRAQAEEIAIAMGVRDKSPTNPTNK